MSKEENIKDWTAVHLSDDKSTKSGFKTKSSAQRYAHKFYCNHDRNLIAKSLRWERKYGINSGEAIGKVYKILELMIDSKKNTDILFELENDLVKIFGDISGDACGCEWMFIPTEKYNKCDTFSDLVNAIGGKRVF